MQTFIQGADWEFSSGDFVRKLRRVADLSQRELAKVSGVSRSLIAKIESGTFDPKVGQLQLLFDQVGWGVTVTDVNGYLVLPLREFEGNMCDGADRRYPAHLDVIVDPQHGEWWADSFGLARPPETFRRSRAARDDQREQSQYELGRGRYRRYRYR
jgi:transcriptional regulator with XRE-family HTH domain